MLDGVVLEVGVVLAVGVGVPLCVLVGDGVIATPVSTTWSQQICWLTLALYEPDKTEYELVPGANCVTMRQQNLGFCSAVVAKVTVVTLVPAFTPRMGLPTSSHAPLVLVCSCVYLLAALLVYA